MSLFFRSWDLFTGLPENLGGMQLFKEYAQSILLDSDMDISDGEIIAYSSGLHIYEQYYSLVKLLNYSAT